MDQFSPLEFYLVLIYHENRDDFNNQFKMRSCCRQNNQMLRRLIPRFTPPTPSSPSDATLKCIPPIEYALVCFRAWEVGPIQTRESQSFKQNQRKYNNRILQEGKWLVICYCLQVKSVAKSVSAAHEMHCPTM